MLEFDDGLANSGPKRVSPAVPLPVGGGIASGGANSATYGPIKIGGAYNTPSPTLTNGQLGDLQVGTRGSLNVTLLTADSVTAIGATTSAADAITANTQGLRVGAVSYLYNNATLDRSRNIIGAVALGSVGTGTMAVEETGRPFLNITTATTTVVKSGIGFVHAINVCTPVASATITVYDNTAASGTKLGTWTLPSTITSLAPFTILLDEAFGTGLTIVTSGATDLNVSYR